MTTIEQKIQDLESITPQVDGKILKYNLGNRIYGFIGTSLGCTAMYVEPVLGIIGVPLIIDGVADMITGRHHTVVYELFKAHPRYEIEKLKQQLDESTSDWI